MGNSFEWCNYQHADANGKDKIAKTIKPKTNAYRANANGPARTTVAGPKDLKAIGDTRYAGRRNFDTTLNEDGLYELKEPLQQEF
jgi:hypothetical protein